MTVGLWTEPGRLMRSLHQVLRLIGAEDQWYLTDNAAQFQNVGGGVKWWVYVGCPGGTSARHRTAIITLLGDALWHTRSVQQADYCRCW